MKPVIEKVSRQREFDWVLRTFQCHHSDFDWHYHLEYELVLFRHAKGKAFVGGHTGSYGHNSLMLFGPGLPHTTLIEQIDAEQVPTTYVLWFSHQWISQILEAFGSMASLATMLGLSSQGLKFDDQLGESLATRIAQLAQRSRSLQGLGLVQLLVEMSESPYDSLNPGLQLQCTPNQPQQLQQASLFIEQHFQSNITLEQLGSHLNMSKSSVQRLFQRHFGENLSDHLKHYRVGKACEWLINTDQPIALIAERAGFANLSNFNRRFKEVKQQTPRGFRSQYRVQPSQSQ